MPRHNDPRDGTARSPVGDLESTARLLERFRSGDQAALDVLFERYLEPLRRWASGRLPPWARDARDTHDLVQDTLLKTFRRLDGFEYRREGAFQAYLRQAVMNDIRYEIRRLANRAPPGVLDSSQIDDRPSPLDEAIGLEAVERYEAALARLRPEEREAIIGRVELGQTYEQLAASLGKPSTEAARQAARRAVLKLAAAMKADR